jgi:transcriptional regulator with GAF, ATPase, and Fis domain
MSDNKLIECLEAIIGLGEKLLTTFDVEEVLRQIVANTQELLKAEGATLYLIDPVEKLLISQVILSDRIEEIVLPVDNTSIAGYTALNRSSLNIPDVYSDLTHIHQELKFNRGIDERYKHHTKSILTLPLVLKGEVLGVFQTVNKQGGDFDENDERILRNFAVLAAIAVFNARLMGRVMDEQAKMEDVVQHISDEVYFLDRQGGVLALNRKAIDKIPSELGQKDVMGKPYFEVFPHLNGLRAEVAKVIDQNLDKAFSGGRMSYSILTTKNSRQLVEKVILIVKESKGDHKPDLATSISDRPLD